VLPSLLCLLAAGLALVGFVAAALFTGEARGQLAELKVQRKQAALDERLLVPVAAVADVDATRIGVDKAVQQIMPGARELLHPGWLAAPAASGYVDGSCEV